MQPFPYMREDRLTMVMLSFVFMSSLSVRDLGLVASHAFESPDPLPFLFLTASGTFELAELSVERGYCFAAASILVVSPEPEALED